MAKFNYGNSFSSYEGENVGVERISIWKSAREFFPGGAAVKAEDYSTIGLTGAFMPIVAGQTIIPAGTPIKVDKPGGKPDFSSPMPIGLTYEDVVLGTDGATFTIVTRGEFLISRKKGPSIDDTTQSRLFGRISFIKEVD